MSLRLTKTEYSTLQAAARMPKKRTERPLPATISPKRHKYHAQRVEIDGIAFASKWEGHVYVTLKWQALAGLITEPLLQVPFALGKHYGRQRSYVSDFVYVELTSGRLVVADAKGLETAEYKRKKRTFAEVYGFCIKELKRLKL